MCEKVMYAEWLYAVAWPTLKSFTTVTMLIGGWDFCQCSYINKILVGLQLVLVSLILLPKR